MDGRDFLDLVKVTFDCMPSELKVQMAAMMKELEWEQQGRLSVLTAIARALDIVACLSRCGQGGSRLSIEEYKLTTRAAAKWVTDHNALEILERAKILMRIGED